MSLDNKALQELHKLRRLRNLEGFNDSNESEVCQRESEKEYEPLIRKRLGRLRIELERQIKPVADATRIHCVLAHSPEHAEWAAQITHQLTDSLLNVLPGAKLTTEPLCLKGDVEEITQTLTDYVKPYGPELYSGHIFIVTPGWWESQMVTAARNGGSLEIPQLFCVPGLPGQLFNNEHAVLHPHLIGGVYSMPTSPEGYVHSVLGFNPDTRSVCIAYDPNPSNEIMAKQMKLKVKDITAMFEAENIDITLHHWTSADIGRSALESKLFSATSVIVFQEPAIEVHRKELIGLCNITTTFICASDLDTVIAGAALGCGVTGATFGIPLAGIILNHVLSFRKTACWATYRIPEQSGMRYNEWFFGLQGVTLDERQQALLRMKSAFDSSCIEL